PKLSWPSRNDVRASSAFASIAEEKVVGGALDTEQAQAWRRLRQKSRLAGETRPGRVGPAARDLRRERQEHLVDRSRRQELAEYPRAALVQDEGGAEFRGEDVEPGRRRHLGFADRSHGGAPERGAVGARKALGARARGYDRGREIFRMEGRLIEVDAAAPRQDDIERVGRLAQGRAECAELRAQLRADELRRAHMAAVAVQRSGPH